MSVTTTRRPGLDEQVEGLSPEDSTQDHDWFAEEAARPVRPSVAPPAAVVETAPAPAEAGRAKVLAGLLRMADMYQAAGSKHQALELYFALIRDHDGSPQADQAADRVLDIARSYERAGELRQARSIYEQLL